MATDGPTDSRCEPLISLHQCVAVGLEEALAAQAEVAGERWNERQMTRNLDHSSHANLKGRWVLSRGLDKRPVVCGRMGDFFADEKAQLRDSGCTKNVSIDTE